MRKSCSRLRALFVRHANLKASNLFSSFCLGAHISGILIKHDVVVVDVVVVVVVVLLPILLVLPPFLPAAGGPRLTILRKEQEGEHPDQTAESETRRAPELPGDLHAP